MGDNNNPLVHLQPRLLKVSQACEVMNVSRAELYRLMKAGELRGILVGPRQRRIPTSEIDAWIERKLAETEQKPETGAA